MTWRSGTKLGRTLYRDEVCVGLIDTAELASEIVAAMNAVEKETAAKLAAATALLERCRDEWAHIVDGYDDPVTQELARDVKDFFADQPAAPTRTPELRPGCTSPDYYEPTFEQLLRFGFDLARRGPKP